MSNLVYLYIVPVVVFLVLIFLLLPPGACYLEGVVECPIYRGFCICIITAAISFLAVAYIVHYLKDW